MLTCLQYPYTELIDNSSDPDVLAKNFRIDVENVDGDSGARLLFADDGNGLEPDRLHRMMSFGYDAPYAPCTIATTFLIDALSLQILRQEEPRRGKAGPQPHRALRKRLQIRVYATRKGRTGHHHTSFKAIQYLEPNPRYP